MSETKAMMSWDEFVRLMELGRFGDAGSDLRRLTEMVAAWRQDSVEANDLRRMLGIKTRAVPGGEMRATLAGAVQDLTLGWKEKIAELEAWQLEVADGTGFLNRPEGQSGYEVAPAATIVQAWDRRKP